MQIKCPRCSTPVEVDRTTTLSDINCPACQHVFALAEEDTVDPRFEQGRAGWTDARDLLSKGPLKAIGRFRLLKHLGSGAIADVWQAQDTQLDRIVAVKFHRGIDVRSSTGNLFVREARAVAKLCHPNIVTVHDVGFNDGQPFVVTEHIDGIRLDEVIARQKTPPSRAAEICSQLARALQHAHERGIVHRDLKPTNILIGLDGQPHILDFGLATQGAPLTEGENEGLAGTPAYMSPEQARGGDSQVDHRTDIHAVGLILFELLTRQRPFRGQQQNLLYEIIAEKAPSPRSLNPQVSPDLEAICLKCLAKEPDHRFATAAALADALDLALASGTADSSSVADADGWPTTGPEQRLAHVTRMLVTLQGEHQLYRALVENLPLGVYRTDVDGRLTFVNEWFCKTTGCLPEEARGRPLGEIIGVASAAEQQADIAQVIATGKVLQSHEKHAGASGVHTFFDVVKSPVRNFQGEVTGVQGLMFDVSAREALRAAKKAAERANELKSSFLANVSHEIRTPMHAILGFTDLLLKEKQSAKQRETLKMIFGSARSLLAIIDDVLDFSKIENDRLTLQIQQFQLRDLLNDVVAMFALQVQGKGLHLRLTIDPGVPANVAGDAQRLRQVLVNLVGNAVKFTDHGEVALEVRNAECEVRNGNIQGDLQFDASTARSALCTLHFAVRDTGIGIPSQHLAEIFKPFVQADGSISRKYGGTGLGLAISSELVHMMGGKLAVESRLEEGSVFRFSIQLPEAGSSEHSSVSKPAEVNVGTARRGLRILVAEDHAMNQAFASQALGSAGHSVVIANHGQEALDLLSSQRFDLVLMDVQMPVMDGLEAAREIRRREAKTGGHIPIIAMTAHAAAGDQENCLLAGMDACLVKPILVDALEQKIDEVMFGLPLVRREPVDARKLLATFADNREFLGRMVGMFREDYPRLLTAIEVALNGRDAKRLAETAHKLLGVVRNFFAKDAAALAQRLESLARQGDILAAAETAAKLPAELEAMQRFLEELPATPAK